MNAIAQGLRHAGALLTVVPTGAGRPTRGDTRWAMTGAPVIGLLVGLAAAVVLTVAELLGTGAGVAATLAIAVIAVLTRGLHLDGLADFADGLGSRRPATEALAIMKRSDIGPFGMIALVFTLLVQVAALSQAPHRAFAVTVAAVAGRLALPLACRQGVPAARPDGLGALVAGNVRLRDAAGVGAATAVLAAAAGLVIGGVGAAVGGAVAVLAGPAAAELLLRHAVRRLGGVTGDVLGALVETSATVSLLILCLRP